MPELPEVQTIVQDLQPLIVGQVIRDMEVILPRTVWLDDVRATGDQEVNVVKGLVEGEMIDSITRRGKMIIIDISGDSVMLIHLKMTGQLIFVGLDHQRLAGGHPNSDMAADLPVKSTRVVFHFQNGNQLYFNDQRQFGYIKVLTKQALKSHVPYTSFGPEPLESSFNEQYLKTIIDKKANLKIKQILLDQTLIAGIGNIYADESLFLAKIRPDRLAKNIRPAEIPVLIHAIKATLKKGLDYGGTSSQHYVQANGQKGTMQDHLAVYRRTDQPCPICGHAIERMVISGRGTHYCPHCQK
jgi:formamidopyrimidine-DNA glycosylase